MNKEELDWEEYYDEYDNTYWETRGPYTDECGGTLGYYRIRQKLQDNRIVFVEDSDEDVWLCPRLKYREEWETLEEAKAEFTENFHTIIEECIKV